MQRTVVAVGYERELLRLRCMLLRQCMGLEVLEALDFQSALQVIRNTQSLALLLLCHTVPALQQQMLIQATRDRFGTVPALSIFNGICPVGGPATSVGSDPKELVETIDEVLKGGSNAAMA